MPTLRTRRPMPDDDPLAPETLLRAYASGVFPMDGAGGLRWYRPDPRAVIPLDDRFRVSGSLARVVRSGRFEVTTDRDFEAVMRACGDSAPGREETWISDRLVAAYGRLHRMGFAHAVECRQDGALVGGLYGVALGGAFFGESMFHTARDASKVALVHLVERLRAGGFVLLDTQFLTDHLARFGAAEIRRSLYEKRLAEALPVAARWLPDGECAPPRS